MLITMCYILIYYNVLIINIIKCLYFFAKTIISEFDEKYRSKLVGKVLFRYLIKSTYTG